MDKSDEHIPTLEKMDMEVDSSCEVEVKDSSVKKLDNLLVLSNSNVSNRNYSISFYNLMHFGIKSCKLMMHHVIH